MITEDDLRRLLADAADSIPPPGRAPEELLAVLVEPATVPSARRRPSRRGLTTVATAAAIVAVALVGVTLVKHDTARTTFQSTGSAISGGADTGSADTDQLTEGLEPADEDGASDGLAYLPQSGGNRLTPGTPDQLEDTAKVIRTGSVDLEVREGAFVGTVARITSQTVGLGGYIAESTTSEAADAPSGSIVVRVPDESFDELLAGVRELGEVKAVTSKGTDVTAQYTDLEARLTALQATRARLGTVLAEAENVPDILAVQDRITQVQIEIEQLQGQQRLLDDQTSMGTLSITVGEPGAEIVRADANDDEGLGSAWDDARRRFGDGLEGIVSWSGAAAVVLIVGLLLFALARVVWVGARRRLV